MQNIHNVFLLIEKIHAIEIENFKNILNKMYLKFRYISNKYLEHWFQIRTSILLGKYIFIHKYTQSLYKYIFLLLSVNRFIKTLFNIILVQFNVHLFLKNKRKKILKGKSLAHLNNRTTRHIEVTTQCFAKYV